jgi:homoserine kinase type II
MAVYTEIPDDEFDAFMKSYDLGQVLSCKGIAEGVENSNFLVVAEAGQFILTLYEKRVAAADLPFFLGLMEHLAAKGSPARRRCTTAKAWRSSASPAARRRW